MFPMSVDITFINRGFGILLTQIGSTNFTIYHIPLNPPLYFIRQITNLTFSIIRHSSTLNGSTVQRLPLTLRQHNFQRSLIALILCNLCHSPHILIACVWKHFSYPLHKDCHIHSSNSLPVSDQTTLPTPYPSFFISITRMPIDLISAFITFYIISGHVVLPPLGRDIHANLCLGSYGRPIPPFSQIPCKPTAVCYTGSY